MRCSFVFCSLAACALSACVLLPRDPACIAAEACDAALERPVGDYQADDQVFGDLGTCWQNAETQKPCIATCLAFVADELAIGQAQNNKAVVEACGGVFEEQ